jgi:hypothetical protein
VLVVETMFSFILSKEIFKEKISNFKIKNEVKRPTNNIISSLMLIFCKKDIQITISGNNTI